jgi:photosystem II stability/assembly factor-like uncharacterized protein
MRLISNKNFNFEQTLIVMKKCHFLLIVVSAFLSLLAYFSIDYFAKSSNEGNPEFPNEWFFMQRAYPRGEINYNVYFRSVKTAQSLKQGMIAAKDTSVWEPAGPVNIGGRLSDVEMHPSDFETIYAGAASGGVYKSIDAGQNWIPVFDDALSLSVGDIAIAPSDPNIIYVGTGEANAGGGSQTYDGVGIYKSVDAGQTWLYCGLPGSRNVGRMAVHPANPEILYVAAMGNLFAENPERGIYKTSDGGQNWENVLYVSDSTGGIDIVIHPNNPDTLYAAMWERVRRPDRRSYGGLTCGIYRTYNGGLTWEELTDGLPSPGANIGRIGIDISLSEPATLYAIYADKIGFFEGLYKSTNNGNSWVQTNDGALADCFTSYGWWFGRISVDPVDPNIAYVIGFDLYKTSNGGNSWSNISSWDVHVDQHELFIHPQNHNFLVLGNDGGLYISENGGGDWSWINNLPVTQFYTCETDQQFPERLYGGTQDNGTNRTMTGNTDDWQNIYGGDGFYVLVDPENNNYVYAEYQYGNFARSTNGGGSFNTAMNGISTSDRKNWCTPVELDPTNPEILYYGANRLYKSVNRAASWTVISTDLTNGPGINLTYGTITAISVSPVNPEIVYVGTDDGNVWVSAESGTGWEYLSANLPDRWVTRIAADPLYENTAYITFSGYRWDEYLPHIFKTTDKGQNWEDISGNLPEMPINDVIIDPENNSRLYVATDAGVYVLDSPSQSWNMLGSNLPNVPVNDLTLHNDSRKLIAATFGRSMYTYDLYQDTVSTSSSFPVKNNYKLNIDIYPNPFAEKVNIVVTGAEEQFGTLEIFNFSGKKVATLFVGVFKSGCSEFFWEPVSYGGFSEGIYILHLDTGDYRLLKKMVFKKN